MPSWLRLFELKHQLSQKHGVLRLKFLQTLRHGLILLHLSAEGHRGFTQLWECQINRVTYLVVKSSVLLLEPLVGNLEVVVLLLLLQAAFLSRASILHEPISC